MSAHKTPIATVATLLLASASSMAAAQGFDPIVARRGGFAPNMANRYPAFAEPVRGSNHASRILTSRDVRLQGSAPCRLAGRRRVPDGAHPHDRGRRRLLNS